MITNSQEFGNVIHEPFLRNWLKNKAWEQK